MPPPLCQGPPSARPSTGQVPSSPARVAGSLADLPAWPVEGAEEDGALAEGGPWQRGDCRRGKKVSVRGNLGSYRLGNLKREFDKFTGLGTWIIDFFV